MIAKPEAIQFVAELAGRYQLTSLRPLLEICQAAEARSGLSIAVLGRFKAGKSSFLNHLLGRDVLPVGVIPVTSVVTEVEYGQEEVAIVRFTSGSEDLVRLTDLALYVTEAENSLNRKQVESVRVQVPALARWPALRFIDTPGLESALAHNTEVSLGWSPHVDVALIAIGVDPPLSERDVALIETLLRFTPRVFILLTKADILDREQLNEVLEYVRGQLMARFEQNIPIYPYSTRPGYESLKRDLEDTFLRTIAGEVGSARRAIVNRKVNTLLGDCAQYLRLRLKSAELLDTERASLVQQLLSGYQALADLRLELGLIARNAAGGTRKMVERVLAPSEKPVRASLLTKFEEESDQLPRNFGQMLNAFREWLGAALSAELAAVSGSNRSQFLQPLDDVQRHYQRVLQNLRDGLSDRTLALYGVPLKTTEPEIVLRPPTTPDVNIGRPFDHNWELLSPVLPTTALRNAILKRFRRKIAEETFKNLSRLTSQWEEILNSAILELQREAHRRVEELLTTVQGLVSASSESAPRIRADLKQLEALAAGLRDAT